MKHASNPAGQTVYISGPITNNPNFSPQFEEAKDLLLKLGYARVLTPTIFPPGWSYEEYMEHCLLMVRHANVVVMLKHWTHSPGATAERAYALSLKREVLELSDHPVYGLWLEGVSQGARSLHKAVMEAVKKGLDADAQYKEDYVDDWAALLQRSTAATCEIYMQHMERERPKLHALVSQRLASRLNQAATQTVHLAHSGVVPRAVAFGASDVGTDEASLRAKEDAEIADVQASKDAALQRAKNGIAKLYAEYVDACREMISLYPDHHVEIPAPRVLPGPVPEPAEVFQTAPASDIKQDSSAEVLHMPWLVQPEAAGLLANEIDAFDELGELCNVFCEDVTKWMQSVPSLKDVSHAKLLRWIAARLSPKQQALYLKEPFGVEPQFQGVVGHMTGVDVVAPTSQEIAAAGEAANATQPSKIYATAAGPVRGRQADGIVFDEFWNSEPSALQPEKFRQTGKSETMTDLIRVTCLHSLRAHFKRTTGFAPTHAIRRYDSALASDEEFQEYSELAHDLSWDDPRTMLLAPPCVGEVAGMCCFYLARRQANGAWIVAQPKSDASKEWAEICTAHDVPPVEPFALDLALRLPPEERRL